MGYQISKYDSSRPRTASIPCKEYTATHSGSGANQKAARPIYRTKCSTFVYPKNNDLYPKKKVHCHRRYFCSCLGISLKFCYCRGELPSEPANAVHCHSVKNKLIKTAKVFLGNPSYEQHGTENDKVVSPARRGLDFHVHSPLLLRHSQKHNVSRSALYGKGVFDRMKSQPYEIWHRTGSSRIVYKLNDPTSFLFHLFRNGLREVTESMILNLLNPQANSLFIHSRPVCSIQEGFQDKIVQIGGSSAVECHQHSDGIGYACKKGLKKGCLNQDDFFILRIDDWLFCGVFDGHGVHGHKVAHFVHMVLPFIILADARFETEPFSVIQNGFRKVHFLLSTLSSYSYVDIDCTLSGTTGTLIFVRYLRGDNLGNIGVTRSLVFDSRDQVCYSASVGDSRAVMCYHEKKECNAMDLTRDHTPILPSELERIRSAGGEVRRLGNEDIFRVFVKGQLYPGLAMSRAIGDTIGSSIGVTPEPELMCFPVREEDKFFVVSTDGVWEFVSSLASISLVNENGYAGAHSAAELLARKSWECWIQDDKTTVDDITCVIVWLHP